MITKYKVVQLADRKMILESHQNLAGLGPDFSTDEVVMETYELYPRLMILFLIEEKI